MNYLPAILLAVGVGFAKPSQDPAPIQNVDIAKVYQQPSPPQPTKVEIVNFPKPEKDTSPSAYELDVLETAKKLNEITDKIDWADWVGSIAGSLALLITLYVAFKANSQQSKQLRAYIDIQLSEISTTLDVREHHTQFPVPYKLKNVGQTPAMDCVTSIRVTQRATGQMAEVHGSYLRFNSSLMDFVTISAGETHSNVVICPIESPHMDNYFENPEPAIWRITIHVTFIDIFGKRQDVSKSWVLGEFNPDALLFKFHQVVEKDPRT